MRTRGWKEEEIGCGNHYDRTTIESGRLAGLDGSTRSRRSAVSLLCLCCHPHGRVVTVLYAMIDCAVTSQFLIWQYVLFPRQSGSAIQDLFLKPKTQEAKV